MKSAAANQLHQPPGAKDLVTVSRERPFERHILSVVHLCQVWAEADKAEERAAQNVA